MNKINLSAIYQIQTLGSIPLRSWKRRKHNRIQYQTQEWLFGNEYFYSSPLQKSRTDEKELKRRENQDLVRREYREQIDKYLEIYCAIARIIRQFWPNYSTINHDNFKLEKSIDRLFEYHLVHKNLEENPRPEHDYEKELDPAEYWRGIIREGITRENFIEIIDNELVHEISPEVALYYKLRNSLTGWYIRKIVESREWMTNTSHIFYSEWRFKDISVDELCQRIREDFYLKLNEDKYAAMFKMFGVSSNLMEKAMEATLNKKGRKQEFKDWYEANKHKWRVTLEYKQPRKYHLEKLKLKEDATKEEIKRAYRKLSLKCHPDITGWDGKEFIDLTKSYDYLISK